ncbi:MAG: hypothetical protein JWQ01_4574 [Massilia sp.]|jgi:hypothetical protein|nr:hypothetical protein [Massilia sp.]
MLKQLLAASLYLSSACLPAGAAELTAQEVRWLAAAGPVLAYSQRLQLPIDIIVQPKARAGDVALAMGFDGKRCKLVVSLRGNPEAERILDKVPEQRRGLLIETMAAHEVGHCWRYVSGVWNALPAGLVDTAYEGETDAALAEAKAMRVSRREEGFADLVALAWIARKHPDRYAEVYGWLETLRGEQPAAAHDTRAWVELAREPAAFGSAATPFDDVEGLWSQGLLIAG